MHCKNWEKEWRFCQLLKIVPIFTSIARLVSVQLGKMVKRRSTRISELQKRAHEQAVGLGRTSTSPPSRKRGFKDESLVSEFTRSLANLHHQGGAYTHNNVNDSAAQPHETERLPSLQQIPLKPALELFLDVLQRRDTDEIFAQPVNGEEVVGYYDIIKEPMDFGTMRAKLHEGMYTSLEQFERDVFLISSNGMTFNAKNTKYYREAEAMDELAQRLFYILKRNPGSFKVEATHMRRRPDRRVQHQASNSRSRGRRSDSLNGFPFKRKAQMLRGPSLSNSFIDQCNNGASTSGLLDDRDLYSCQVDKRRTYMPQRIGRETDSIVSEVLKAPKSLQQVDSAGTQYTSSLMRFVEDLGQTAQTVAEMKYPTHSSKSPSLTPFFGLAPEPSAFQRPAFMSGGIGDILSNTSAACKGKAVYTNNRPSYYHDFGASRPITNLNLAGNEGTTWSRNASALNLSMDSMDHGASGGYCPLTGHGSSGLAPTAPNPPPQAYFTWLLNHPEPDSSTSAQRPPIGEGLNVVEQYYAGKAAELASLKQTTGEGPRIVDLRVSGRPLTRGQGRGQGGRSPAPHLLGQNYAWPMGSSLAGHSVLNANNTLEPVSWKMPNGDGSSSGRDQNDMGRAVQWRLPERLGLSTSDLNHMERLGLGVSERQVAQSRAPMLSTVYFFGGSGSQGHGQAQESSMIGDGLPDLDLQL